MLIPPDRCFGKIGMSDTISGVANSVSLWGLFYQRSRAASMP
jgi:hypothetical protein